MTAMPRLDDFLRWLAKARKGQARIYHVGSLMYDRCRSVNSGYNEVDAIANAAWAAHEQGDMQLSQRKTGQFTFEYRATAR